MKHILTKLLTFCLILACSIPTLQSYAAENATITEKYVEEDTVILYVSGVEGEVQELSYQIGNTACEVLEYQTIQKMDEPIYTLILWDNSNSVMKKYKEDIKDVLVDIVANRAPEEKFSIVTLEKDMTVLSDYTNDYAVLKQSINSVEEDNKSVYIIENLYNCLKDFQEMEDYSYKRVILVSDGSGDEGTGYTKTELEHLLAEQPFPIYSIGVGTDEAGLQYMFSLSRTTGADAFHLDEMKDNLQVSETIAKQYGTLQIKVKVPTELLDGSTRNSLVSVTTTNGNFSAQSQVKLPFLSEVPGAEQSTVVPGGNETAEPTDEPTPEPTATEQKDTQKPTISEGASQVTGTPNASVDNSAGKGKEKGLSLSTGIIIAVFGIAIIAVIIAIILILSKKKKSSENWNLNIEDTFVEADNEKTERYEEELTAKLDDELTQKLQDFGFGVRFQLSEVSDPAIMYRCTISSGKIVIGRKSALCNLVITNDKAVSGEHCEVYTRMNKFYVKDMKSTNGTFVDGVQVFGETEIKNGSILKLGTTEYRVTIG